MNKTANFYIGTSGWSYKHWRGNFYPQDMSERQYLSYYTKNFPTVEINTTFYHLPKETTISTWYENVPNDFIFSVKASRYITHMKKLTEPEEPVSLFFERIAGFKEKLGPILFQLPPRFVSNHERLKSFLEIIPENHKYAFEFRDTRWFNQAVYKLLREYNVAFCIYNLGDYFSPKEITADFVYIRYHGPINLGQGLYDKNKLTELSNDIRDYLESGKDVFCYFNNDQAGYATRNARELQDILLSV